VGRGHLDIVNPGAKKRRISSWGRAIERPVGPEPHDVQQPRVSSTRPAAQVTVQHQLVCPVRDLRQDGSGREGLGSVKAA
jgi:hypothetical protein